MQINKLNGILLGGMLAGTSLLVSGCDGTYNRFARYMRENNRTQQEFETMLYRNEQYNKKEQECILQATLDSMAYRDLLNTTKAANDSEIVAEFNALAGRTNISRITLDKNDTNVAPNKAKILKMVKNEGVTKKEYDEVNAYEKEIPEYSHTQHFADKLLYSKFFTKHGLMTKDFKEKFDSIANVIRPSF